METQKRFGIATGALVDERDDWDAAVERIAAEDWRVVELTAISEARFDALEHFLSADDDLISRFERVTIHAPVRFHTSAREVLARLTRAAPACDAILHPDVYVHETAVAKLGKRAVFENMDIQKSFGRDVRDLRAVFERWPDAGFCLDVAHVRTNDPGLGLAHHLLDAFEDRLRQLHVSGIEPDGTHRETTRADLDEYSPVLERCDYVPWILETIIDP